jgi:hypothetical protein
MMKEMWMRSVMVALRKGFETAAAVAAPGAEAVARLMGYNKSLQKAAEGFEELSNAAAVKA